MKKKVKKSLSSNVEPSSSPNQPSVIPSKEKSSEGKFKDVAPWPDFIEGSPNDDIKARFSYEIKKILSTHSDLQEKYCCLALLEPSDNIDSYDLNKIANALTELNAKRKKDVLLILLSRGGSIEPAYQISKMCKSLSKGRFIVTVPRHAKSAATLIALGADEIHMGPLGQLGPIDPQLDGLPALGVSQALKSIASLAEKYPGSSEMFARYLRMALTVEQIGYCERISESAAQYAERLLSTKKFLDKRKQDIARELVHEYKDHGFVIDLEEAKMHLGQEWIKTDTIELKLTDEIYKHFDMVNRHLQFNQKNQRLLVVGRIDSAADFMILKNRSDR